MCNLRYNEKSLTQMVNFFTEKIPGIGLTKLCKLIYLTERLRLRKHGQLMSETSFVITMIGIIPTNVLSLHVQNTGIFDSFFLSESGEECLNTVFDRFGTYSREGLVSYTNKLPEYAIAITRMRTTEEHAVCVKDFLLEPDPVLEELCPLDNRRRSLLSDYIDEWSSVNRLLSGE